MINLTLDCPIRSGIFGCIIPMRGRITYPVNETVFLDLNQFVCHFYTSQNDADRKSNSLFSLYGDSKNNEFVFNQEALSKPFLQDGDIFCVHYNATLKHTHETDSSRSYYVRLEYKDKNFNFWSNPGAFNFVPTKNSFVTGPECSLAPVVNDSFLILPFWLALKNDTKVQIEQAFTFVNPETAIKRFIHVGNQSSPELSHVWPDASNSENAWNTCYVKLNESKTDMSTVLQVKDAGGSSTELFFGNTTYDPKCYEYVLDQIILEDGKLKVSAYFWHLDIEPLEIIFVKNECETCLYSNYLRADNAYLSWRTVNNFSSEYAINWSSRNHFTLTIPVQLFFEKGARYSLRLTYGNNCIDLNEDSKNALTEILSDIAQGEVLPVSYKKDHERIDVIRIPKRTLDTDSILFCFHNLRGTEGAPRVLYNIVSKGKFKKVHVVSFNDGELKNPLVNLSTSIKIFKDIAIQELTSKNYDAAFDVILKYLQEVKPRCVVINSIDSFLLGDVASRLGIPVLWIIHESVHPLSSYFFHDVKIRYRFIQTLERADHVIFVSEETRTLYSDFIPLNKSHVIRNGIDIEDFQEKLSHCDKNLVRQNLPINVGGDEYLFLTVGTTVYRKGQDRTVRELARMREKYPNVKWKFLIVGGRKIAFLDELIELIKYHNMEDVITVVDETPDIHKYYKAADFYICNSREESSPLVILEAMISRVPVVSTDVFGLKEILTDELNALVFDGEEEGSLIDALSRLIENNELRDNIVSCAYEDTINKFHLSTMVTEYESVIERLKKSKL